MIVAVAIVMWPVVISGPSDDGTFITILNVSFPSTILSFLMVTFTVLQLAPARIVKFSGAESKSMSVPTYVILMKQVGYLRLKQYDTTVKIL